MSFSAINSSVFVSIIIPVYRGGKSFLRCLQGISEAIPKPQEIIVVYDGDPDSSLPLAKQLGAQVIETLERSGPAHARNLGARVAKGDILFFVDADVVVRPDAIARVVAAFATFPEVSALIGSYDDAPGATNFLSQYKNLFHHYIHQISNEDASTFWGACGAIRRDVFLSIGGFDESYRRPCIEDIELGYRLKAAGYKIWLDKDLQVKHLKCWRPFSLLKAEVFDRALPWTELLLQQRRFTNDLNLSQSSRLSVISVYSLLASLAFASWLPLLLVVAGASAILLLLINTPVYRFFQHQRGLWFTVQVIPWHWLYYLYGGFAFALGIFSYCWKAVFSSNTNPYRLASKSISKQI